MSDAAGDVILLTDAQRELVAALDSLGLVYTDGARVLGWREASGVAVGAPRDSP